jgi:hypothetical protein
MKISVDGQHVFELNETKKNVLKWEIQDHLFDADMKRRLQWVLMHKYETVFEAFKKEWEPRLKANGVKAIPLDNDEFAQLVFSQPDYKSRVQRGD